MMCVSLHNPWEGVISKKAISYWLLAIGKKPKANYLSF